MTKRLYLDFETRSRVDLNTSKKSTAKLRGPANYFRHESTEILCAAYAVDDGPVHVWLPDEPPPIAIRTAIKAGWEIHAHNAEFELGMWQHVATHKYGWPWLPVEQIFCTAAKAAFLNLPRALGNLSVRLNLPEHLQIVAANKSVNQTCKPFTGNKIDWENGTFKETPELLAAIVEDCKRDVETERYIDKLLPDLPYPERELWLLHVKINNRGVPIDLPMVRGGCEIISQADKAIRHQLAVVTDGEITSPSQSVAIAQYVGSANVKAETVDALLQGDLPENKRLVLEARQAQSFAAVKKYPAALAQQVGGRLLQQYVYYGAGPGRWTATGVQPANFKRLPKKFPADQVAESMAAGDYKLMEWIYGRDALKIMSQAVRPMVCASEGKKLVGADLSAVEARGVQWLAEHERALKEFRDFDKGIGDEPYRIMATQIYGCTLAEIDDAKRFVGKVAILGLGYRQGAGTFANTNGKFGITLDFAQKIVQVYRITNRPVVKLWEGSERAAMETVLTGNETSYKKLGWSMWRDFLVMHLPSNRDLFYHLPRVEPGRFGDVVTYVASRPKKGARKDENGHHRIEMHGGVWAENAVQAICRDVFCYGMEACEDGINKLPIVLHTYDNLIAEVDKDDDGALDRLHACMTLVPEWATGFPVAASREVNGRRYVK